MPVKYSLHRGRHRRKKRSILALALLVICFIAGVIFLRMADGGEIAYDEETLAREAQAISEIVDVGGIACIPKHNIRTYLFMGIDNTARRGENFVTGGQSDVLVLLVVDHTNKTYQRLPINRNTMCEINNFDMDGNVISTTVNQIALAHAKGDGGQKSCENVIESLSKYLYGVDIDHYIALEMEAIGTVNRLAGGVTVTIEDDFSATDPDLVKGETITLTDKQAETFVRARMGMVDDGTNEARMRRQQVFMDAMREQMLEKARADSAYALQVYDELLPDMVTNMNGKAFSRLVNGLTTCENLGSIEIKGQVGVDEYGLSTFEPDADSVRDAVIQLYYRRADDSYT